MTCILERQETTLEPTRPVYYLHVGPPKTGTTFLQSLLRAHRDDLARDGILFPSLGRYGRFLAALDGRDKHTYRGQRYDAAGQWQRFVDKSNDFRGRVVFSHELLGSPRADSMPTALRALESYEVHIVLTARDPGRQLPSCWQQHLRHGRTTTFAEYVASIEPDAPTPETGRFAGQRVDRIVQRWAEHVPAERIHVVTLPPSGSDPELLWTRFCSLLGADASPYPVPEDANPNTSLGVAQIEHLRRVNAVAADRLGPADRRRLVRKLYALQILPRTARSDRPALPAYAAEVATRLADGWTSTIESTGVDVVGDLNDLRPAAPSDTDPDAWDADQVLRVGAEAAVELLIAYGRQDRGPGAV